MTEYIERLFGYKPRSTQEKLRVAEALEELPLTARALEDNIKPPPTRALVASKGLEIPLGPSTSTLPPSWLQRSA